MSTKLLLGFKLLHKTCFQLLNVTFVRDRVGILVISRAKMLLYIAIPGRKFVLRLKLAGNPKIRQLADTVPQKVNLQI